MCGGSVENKVSRFLFKYQVTPHSTTRVPQAELMFGRQLRTTLDLLQPSIGQNVRLSQAKQKKGMMLILRIDNSGKGTLYL